MLVGFMDGKRHPRGTLNFHPTRHLDVVASSLVEDWTKANDALLIPYLTTGTSMAPDPGLVLSC